MEITEAEILEAGFVPMQKSNFVRGKGVVLVTMPGEYINYNWWGDGKKSCPELMMCQNPEKGLSVQGKIGGLFFKLTTVAEFAAFVSQVIPKFCEPK